jgi:hypothetical protein
VVCSRVHKQQEALSAGIIALEISSRNSRVAARQNRWDCLRAGLDLILDLKRNAQPGLESVFSHAQRVAILGLVW